MNAGGLSGCLVCGADTQRVTEPKNPKASDFFCARDAEKIDADDAKEAKEERTTGVRHGN